MAGKRRELVLLGYNDCSGREIKRGFHFFDFVRQLRLGKAAGAVNAVPVGVSTSSHTSTGTSYANRHWYIDLGPNDAQWRITHLWTRVGPTAVARDPGFASLWWDDDNDNVNDGTTAATMNFNTGTQLWWKDRDFTSTPITPLGRYLVVSVGPSPTDRPNEFAFVGYLVP